MILATIKQPFPFTIGVLPEVIPPLEGDQVAEPLVHELVSNDAGHPLLVVAGALALVVDEVGLAEGDESPVLGGARGVVGDGGHVQLGQWVGNLGE